MTPEEFINKFPVGTIISYIPGMYYVKSGIREFMRIDRYEKDAKGNYYIFGIWCGFYFKTTRYKKEYTLDDLSKWHCINCSDYVLSTSLGTLLYKYNDVRVVNDVEKNIFYTCLNRMEND